MAPPERRYDTTIGDTMAYEAVTAVSWDTVSGRRQATITVAETDASSSDEWSVDLQRDTTEWRLVAYKVTLTGGSGSTVNPKLGNTTGWTSLAQADQGTNTNTAAHINDQTPLILDLPTFTLYGVSQVDAGADNVISTKIVLLEGAQR